MGRNWKGDILIADIEELEKLDASETFSGRLNASEVLMIQKRRTICPFEWQMVQQHYQEETMNSKNPLGDGNPPQGERLSAKNLDAIGKSFNLKNPKKMTQKSRMTSGGELDVVTKAGQKNTGCGRRARVPNLCVREHPF